MVVVVVDLYTGWSKEVDSLFPKPLGNICRWLCDAEDLLRLPPVPPMAELDDVKASFLKHQVRLLVGRRSAWKGDEKGKFSQ